MDTNAESPMQNKVIEYVKQYAMITLSISIDKPYMTNKRTYSSHKYHFIP